MYTFYLEIKKHLFTKLMVTAISITSVTHANAGCDEDIRYWGNRVIETAARAEAIDQSHHNLRDAAIATVTARAEAIDQSHHNLRNEAIARVDRENEAQKNRITQLEARIEGMQTGLTAELQRILRAQTCEDRMISAAGTPERAIQITEKLDCIKTALNRWRGVNEAGQTVPITEGNQLSREQVAQMLRVLEVIHLDIDTKTEQQQWITDTLSRFVHINLI